MEGSPLLRAALLLLLLAALLLRAAAALWWRPRRMERHFAKQGIRGPPYRFFIGNAREIVGLMLAASSQPMPSSSHNILPRVLSFYHHWKKIYGTTFLVWFGSTLRMTVSDPDLVREILASRSGSYEKKEAHPALKQLEGDGLFSLKGQKWAHHRNIISQTFKIDNLKLSIPVVAKSVVEMAERWSENPDGVEVEVSDWFQTLTEDIITRTVFGSSYEDGKAIFRLQAQQMVLATEAFQKVFIPCYRFLPTRRNVSCWRLDREIRRSLSRLIERRRREECGGRVRVAAEGGGEAKDLLGLMIRASAGPPEQGRITHYDIVEECRTFFFAGKQTTASLLTWTAVLLAMHPEWQALAREEVRRVCGARGVPTRDDVARLKTLGMILQESLRLYPPTVATIRRAKADVALGPYAIPAGTELLIPILAVHHDAAAWGEDADEFNPGRFEEGATRAGRHPVAFIPFGLGPRTCIGQNLALLHGKLVLALLLQRFSLRLSPRYRHAPAVTMLLHPQHGAPLIFQNLPPEEPRRT